MKRIFTLVIALVCVAGWLTVAQQQPSQAAQERKAIKLDARVYDSYVGQYELNPNFIITIRREADGLSLQATNQPKFEIFAESETKFFLTVVDAQISFVKNDKGEVTHLILHQGGADQRAKKISATAPAASNQPAPAPLDLPVEIRVPVTPTPVKGDGKIHLAYELHLTNFAPRDLTLVRLEVLDGEAKALAQYEGAELNTRLQRPGLPPSATDKARLGGGMRAVVYLWLSFDTAANVPAALRHRLSAKIHPPATGNATSGEIELKGESQDFKVRTDLLTIAPPLRGGEWIAANGPSNTSGHRRALIPVSGGVNIAQRFAIDWVQLYESGKTFNGDQLKNASYRCYGAEALAVTDAVVAAVKDGIPENVPGVNSRAVPITLETIGGNYVILDLGGGRYAFYAHLQPGSLRVKVGEQVKRGQTLGLVGNSGNSTEPHLHFHVSDGNSPLGSEGLPYVLEAFEVQGNIQSGKPVAKPSAEKRTQEIPLENQLIRFPGAR